MSRKRLAEVALSDSFVWTLRALEHVVSVSSSIKLNAEASMSLDKLDAGELRFHFVDQVAPG